MRDKRFIAVHRGGPLDRDRHNLMAAWAADCAEHVLPLFERACQDDRPRKAIAVARSWARGEVSVGAARDAAVAAHAAAREADDESAVAAARSAAHAVATAHMADHCLGPVYYALKAIKATDGSEEAESCWQMEHLPEAIRPLIESGLKRKYPGIFHFKAIET